MGEGAGNGPLGSGYSAPLCTHLNLLGRSLSRPITWHYGSSNTEGQVHQLKVDTEERSLAAKRHVPLSAANKLGSIPLWPILLHWLTRQLSWQDELVLLTFAKPFSGCLLLAFFAGLMREQLASAIRGRDRSKLASISSPVHPWSKGPSSIIPPIAIIL